MKASLVFCGTDSYGRRFEVALSTQKIWFSREYVFNGYGKGYSKWKKCEPCKVKFYTENRKFSNGITERCHIAAISNGWHCDLTDVMSINGTRVAANVRLPKIAL